MVVFDQLKQEYQNKKGSYKYEPFLKNNTMVNLL